MKIAHIAIWVNDLERMKSFYSTYFAAQTKPNYQNPLKHFESSFLLFDEGATIELMRKTNHELPSAGESMLKGYTHLAISVGTKQMVDQLTKLLANDGFTIISQPRTTGDGYYESVVEDPEGNLVEITE